jgi:hypothetical protein
MRGFFKKIHNTPIQLKGFLKAPNIAKENKDFFIFD